jgi:type IV fimbrial biogenesis protein FimT
MKNHHGYTLNELIITLAIMAVLLGLAIPSFASLMRSMRLTTINNELVGALAYARSEAVKRETVVIVKPVTAFHWESGWTVETTPCATECVLRTYAPLTHQITLRGKITTDKGVLSLDSLTFLPSGGIDNSGYLVLCDHSNPPTPEPGYIKAIAFNHAGHLKSAKDTNNNQLPDIDHVDVNSCD